VAKDPQNTPELDGANIDALPKSLRDSIDLNNEYAGRETGRMKRFLTARDANGPQAEKEKDERHFTRLMQLLSDPNYAKAYYTTEAMVERAEGATEIALARNAEKLQEAQEQREQLRASAADAPDGRKIFASKDGNVYYEDGSKVTDPSVQKLAKGSPSWEDFQRTQETIERLERERRAIEDYSREVLDPARSRLNDQNNPPSEEELERIRHDLETRMPGPVREAYDEANHANASPVAPSALDDDYLSETALNAPDLPAHFKAAHDAGPSLAAAPLPGIDLKRTV
jgi:hypothetical protein